MEFSHTRLQKKVQQNKERREHDRLQKVCKSPIPEMLRSWRRVFSQDFFEAMHASPFPTYENGKLITKDNFEVYFCIEYDQIAHVQEQLINIQITFNPSVAIYLGIGPIYESRIPLNQELAVNLLPLLSSGDIRYILMADRGAGLIVDSYCGYLQTRPPTTSEEVVYEIVYYQTNQQKDAIDALTLAPDL